MSETTVKRLRRTERRDQILNAATRVFARTGYAGTGLDDITAEAGVSKVILYRHFDSKKDLYKAVLDHICGQLADTVGTDNFTADSIDTLLRAAATNPDGFRLLFRHAAREPEFRPYLAAVNTAGTDIAHRSLADKISDPSWSTWATQLAPTMAIEAVLAWLDADQPSPDDAAKRIRAVIDAVITAAQTG